MYSKTDKKCACRSQKEFERVQNTKMPLLGLKVQYIATMK